MTYDVSDLYNPLSPQSPIQPNKNVVAMIWKVHLSICAFFNAARMHCTVSSKQFHVPVMVQHSDGVIPFSVLINNGVARNSIDANTDC